MMCYRDMTFCGFNVHCAKGESCPRALTAEVWEEAEGLGIDICQFVEHPECFTEYGPGKYRVLSASERDSYGFHGSVCEDVVIEVREEDLPELDIWEDGWIGVDGILVSGELRGEGCDDVAEKVGDEVRFFEVKAVLIDD